MNDDVWKRGEMQSPCVKVCMVHPTERICTGCFRTLDEIAAWSRMSDAERADLVAALPERAQRLKTRRGGRAARLRSRGNG